MGADAIHHSLRKDRQTLYNVLDNLPLGIAAFDPTGKIIFINQHLADLVERPFKDLVHMSIFQPSGILAEDDSHPTLFTACLAGNEINTQAILTAGGETVPVRVHGFPLRDKEERIVGVVILVRDIQEIYLLERSQQEYMHVLEAVNVGMLSVDETGVVTNCNEIAARFCQATGPELLGRKIKEFSSLFGLAGNRLVEHILRFEPLTIPELVLEVDEQEHLVSLDCAPVKTKEGDCNGAVIMLRDISAQRLMENQVSRAEQLNIVGELAAGIAHEIRNPLTSIRGFIQLLKNRFPTQAAEQDYLDIMLDELDRANEIIKKFLVLAKPHNPSFQLQEINYLLDDILKLVEGEALIANVNLIRDFKKELPMMMVETESIKQVFLNLIQNAVQAMPNGGKLTVSTDHLHEENMNIVKIIDTGTGIPSHLLDQIGSPFFTTREEGTGLGLMISHRIVANHRGKIEIASVEGQGTTFTVRLPVVNNR